MLLAEPAGVGTLVELGITCKVLAAYVPGGLERSFEEFARSRTEQGEDAHRSAAEINEKYDSEFVGPPL